MKSEERRREEKTKVSRSVKTCVHQKHRHIVCAISYIVYDTGIGYHYLVCVMCMHVSCVDWEINVSTNHTGKSFVDTARMIPNHIP